MTDPTRWTNLRNLLAELYPDDASMRRLLADAGIPAGRITLGSSAVNNWHDILTEAEKSGKTAALRRWRWPNMATTRTCVPR